MIRLILIPGLGVDGSIWQPQIVALSPRVSVSVTDVHQRFATLPEMASALLEENEGPLLLCGTSMGGYIALEAFRQVPERIAGLALLGASARADTPDIAQRRHATIAAIERGEFEQVVAANAQRAVHPDRAGDAALVGTIIAGHWRTGPELFVRQTRAVAVRPDSRDLLPMIRCPTTVVCGLDDQVLPVALSREIAMLVRGARLVEIPDCGHVATLERPGVVNAALDAWLSDCLARFGRSSMTGVWS